MSVLNEALPLHSRASTCNSRVRITSLQNVPYYRFLYEKVENKCFHLRDRLRNITDGLIEANRLQERANEDGREFSLSPVNQASQERVWCCGRVCNEGDTGNLNPYSVALEGANGR